MLDHGAPMQAISDSAPRGVANDFDDPDEFEFEDLSGDSPQDDHFQFGAGSMSERDEKNSYPEAGPSIGRPSDFISE